MKLSPLFRRFLDRRRENKPVLQDRRRKQTFAEADKRLKDAVVDFEQTVSIKREDLLKRIVNDAQQVVIFSTYRDICPAKGPEIGGMRLCRHPEHPHANDSAVQICEESLCPRMALALKGIA